MIDSESQWHAMRLEGLQVAIARDVGDSVLYHAQMCGSGGFVGGSSFRRASGTAWSPPPPPSLQKLL